jgi:hypothetical protein
MRIKFRSPNWGNVPIAVQRVGHVIDGNGANLDRRGSVLLVVIGLLGMLLLLGIAFYTFAGQEIISGQNYADAAKSADDDLPPDKLWDFALTQLILGPDTSFQQSALYGRRHALLTGLLGRTDFPAVYDGFDLTPFNGNGIHLQYSNSPGFVGEPFVDLNYNGSPDLSDMTPPVPTATINLLEINFSPAANGIAAPAYPAPDVDYTGPDINNLALSFVGRGIDKNGNDVGVIIPTFHRPQLLRQGGGLIADWESSTKTTRRILRPHPEHICVGSTQKRFIQDNTTTNALGDTIAPFPFGTSSGPGANLKQGVWDLGAAPSLPVGSPVYQWDVDNDGDGVKEGIWLDLDYPVQTMSDGRKFVPLFSFTVVDDDGLINLNVSGNQLGFTLPGTPFLIGGGKQISRSNMGLSRAEISPAWAMLANPPADPASTSQHNIFWNIAPGSFNRTEMANSEALFLNIGRPDFSDVTSGSYSIPTAGATTYEPTQYYPGRYNELELMGNNNYTSSGHGIAPYGSGANRDFTFLPQPGKSNQMTASAMFPYAGDDDSDALIGQSYIDSYGYNFTGTSFVSSQSNVAVRSFSHPSDFRGNGVDLQPSPDGMRMTVSNGGLTVPGVWPYYQSGFSSPGTDNTSSGFLNYLSVASGNLIPSAFNTNADEPDEIVAELAVAKVNQGMLHDSVFNVDNMMELQATATDLNNVTLKGRMRDLAPFNFKLSLQAELIRKQFTVLSHDRRNFGLGVMGSTSELNGAINDSRRMWQFNADSDSDLSLEFPPQFVSVAGTDPNEPFRQAVRALLFVEAPQVTSAPATYPGTLNQLRLNLNKLLSHYDIVNGPVTSSNQIVGVPVYRSLTAHPTTLGNTPIVVATWNADNPTGTPSANDQEYWARRDRQMLARDIYVLLYTLGGGDDTINYTADNAADPMTKVRPIYSDTYLKEIAQFAVNVVDAHDPDEVITQFEYDKNLHDGWNLDDNPYNAFSDPETTSNVDRAVVRGVEAQKLTFSEALGIISRKVKDTMNNGVDHIATQINDSAGDRYYTYLELRNASPYGVDLSNGEWQIAVQNNSGPDGNWNTGDETDLVQLTLLSGTAGSTIAPGDLFTIGNRGGVAASDPANPTNNLPSLFKVDTTGATTPDFTAANPASWIVTSSTSPLSLDLIPQVAGQPNNTSLFLLTDGTGAGPGGVPGIGQDVTTSGNFLYGGTGGNVNAADEMNSNPHTFILRRRSHPTRTRPVAYQPNIINNRDQNIDNPWVEVDRMSMAAWREFALSQSDMMAQVQNKLLPLASFERAQPFSRGLTEAAHAPAVAPNYQAHTIGLANTNSPVTFNQIQLHFDRDFASVVDLLSVPLYGPDDVTRRVGAPAYFNDSSTTAPFTSYLAQERILRPQSYNNLNGMGAPSDDNRWYRLFDFVEVPTQSETALQSYPFSSRTSGALNLNMIRTRGVLAGLLDDPDNYNTSPQIEGHFAPNFNGETVMLQDQYEGRDWWLQFLTSRDGFDPLTGLILPGTPGGRPFRGAGFSARGLNSIDDTVLRSLPIDVTNAAGAAQMADRRGLFEARTNTDRPSQTGGDVVDPYTRHRLLRKVVNNGTTRSNVFSVWITTRFFEAAEVQVNPSTKVVRVGDALKGVPDHRGFFVVDRSLPELAYQPNTGKFDFRKFIQYRKTIQ